MRNTWRWGSVPGTNIPGTSRGIAPPKSRHCGSVPVTRRTPRLPWDGSSLDRRSACELGMLVPRVAACQMKKGVNRPPVGDVSARAGLRIAVDRVRRERRNTDRDVLGTFGSGELYWTHSPRRAMTASPARTSNVPPRCAIRSIPLSTTVYSSNSGVWPGSTQPAGLRMCAMLTAGVFELTRPMYSSICFGSCRPRRCGWADGCARAWAADAVARRRLLPKGVSRRRP